MNVKEKLIDAAEKCLLEKGSHAACVKTIAENAGVNHGLVHHYFGSKEGLFIELAKRYFQTIKPEPGLSLNCEEDVVDYLINSIIPSSKIMLEFRAMSFNMPELHNELVYMATELRSSMQDVFQIDEEHALILMSSVFGLGFHSILGPSVDVEKHIKIIVDILLNNKTPQKIIA